MSSSEDIVSDVRAFLKFQGELGWKGRSAAAPAVSIGAVSVSAAEPAASIGAVSVSAAECAACKQRAASHQTRARVMFVSEGVGPDAESLDGEAGDMLAKMIQAMKLPRAQVCIARLSRCDGRNTSDALPPGELAACAPFLRQQIMEVKPEIIVALGRHAVQTLLRDTTALSSLRGKWREYEGIPLMPTYHPAYLLRSPAEKRPVWDDLKNVMARLG